MRGTNRMRSLLISGAVVLLALSIVVGMTWALFTDTETLNHHLKAGDLDITLTRTRLTTRYLDNADGYLKDYSDGSPKDFTNTTANVFDIANGAIVVPGSTYVAEMEITNESDVAFMYWVEVVYKIVGADGTVIENPTTDINLELGKQIELKVISALYDKRIEFCR